MSEETKKTVQDIERFFKTIEKASEDIGKGGAATIGDKELSTKIQKVKESASEVVKHIEKKVANAI